MFPLNFFFDYFKNDSEIDSIFLDEAKERVNEVFFIFNDLFKIKNNKFKKMVKNIFISYFLFPLLLEIINEPKNCQLEKRESFLLFIYFLEIIENKKIKNLALGLLLKNKIKNKITLKNLKTFFFKFSKIEILSKIINEKDEFINNQLQSIYKTRSYYNKMSLQSFEKIPNLAQKIIKQIKSSIKIDDFRNLTKNIGEIAFLEEKDRLKEELSKSPLVIIKKKNEKENEFKICFFENIKVF